MLNVFSRLSRAPRLALAMGIALAIFGGEAQAQKVKTLVTILGAEPLHIEGTGIVTGLNGTGDKSPAALKLLRAYLGKSGFALEEADLESKNIALVRVDATIPPFIRPGERVSVRVTAINGAASIENGVLQRCLLRLRPDGEPVAWAWGRVIVGSGGDGLHPTSGQIPAGADSGAQIISTSGLECEYVRPDNTVRLNLNRKSFRDAAAIAEAINSNESTNPHLVRREFGGEAGADNGIRVADAIDAGQVIVRIPDLMLDQKVEYVSQILDLDVAVEQPARVLLNRQTKTVIISGDVRIDPVAISHRNLSVTLTTPPPNSGEPRRYRLDDIDKRTLVELDGLGRVPNLQNLVNTLNAMGVTTDDILVILEKLKALGALHAELIVE